MVTNEEIWSKKCPESTGISTKTRCKYERWGQYNQRHCLQVANKNGGKKFHMQYYVVEHSEHSMDTNYMKTKSNDHQEAIN